jgi:biopolymer transport protein TolR
MSFGRLERTESPKPMSDINVTPLVDVMLVLVVIFIITAPLLASSIKIDLPNAAGAQTAGTVPAFVTLVMNKSGQVFLNDQALSLAQLQTRLEQVALQNPDTEIQLRADEAVSYGKVAQVMGMAQNAGLGRIGFVANPASNASPP